MMSSLFIAWFNFTIPNALHLLGIFITALLLDRLLRRMTDSLVKPASSQARVAQTREQQTRTLASALYSAGSRMIWVVAVLTALPEFGIGVLPVVALAGLSLLGLGFGAQNIVRDILAGFYIAFEDQYVPGDTIQTGGVVGRVEQLTLRRTVVRDFRGAIVTIANGDVRTVSNLSRDWSQAFVDVAIASEAPLEKSLQALETAAAGLRSDPSWSQALVDGPRVLGLQVYDRTASTVRLQVRTVPTRQDEVSRELRRRIQIEFQRQSIPVSRLQRHEPSLESHGVAERTEPELPS
jgi:small-conductance mechanosensitive channel